MFLITGGLGKIGTIIRTNIEELADAEIFDIAQNEDEDIRNRTLIEATLDKHTFKAVIHLAELGQVQLTYPPTKNHEIFSLNTFGVRSLIDISRNRGIPIIYTTDLNKGRSDYDRSKRLNENRLLSHLDNAYILPLPVTLPSPVESVKPQDLFSLLLKFAIEENGVFKIDRGPEDMIYLGTEDMISLAFEELVVGLEQKEAGMVENDYFIAIKTANFIEMLKRHFPETQILPSPQRRVGGGTELAVEVLEQYLTSLPISALYQAPAVVIEAPTEEVISADIPTEDIAPDAPVAE